MLTKEQMENNKQRFLQLVSSIDREGANTQELVDFLFKSDFFTSPASTKYHCNYEGGLCEHSLNVYDNLCNFASTFLPRIDALNDDSLKIIGLFHDLSKAGFYESYFRNVNTGKKDERGKDIWEKVEEYKVKDNGSRFLLRDHEVNSAFLLNKYIPLTDEEFASISNHHGGWGMDTFKAGEVSAIYEKYTLAVLLHLADMASVYIDECRYE